MAPRERENGLPKDDNSDMNKKGRKVNGHGVIPRLNQLATQASRLRWRRQNVHDLGVSHFRG